MGKKLKIMTILGTRPEIIRLSEVIKACDKNFEHVLVHTGQNYDYELSGVFFKELALRKPDYTLNCIGNNLGETMGNVIAKTYVLINEVKPDAVLILGDTNSALSAVSARRLKIPVFHMEAGGRCGDWDVPETTNRMIVDHISNFNFPYTKVAYDNLIREGMPADRTFITGSPMKEVIMAHKAEIDDCDVLKTMGLKDDGYIVMFAHREENVDIPEKFDRLYPALNKIADEYKMPVIFSVHPRTQKQFDKKGFKLSKYIQDDKPFGFFEYINLQKHAYVVLSDSGTLTEESSILDFPAVLIRTSTERQEGIIHGSIIQGGVDYDTISDAIKKARKIHKEDPKLPIVPDYDVDDVSAKVVEQIKTYFSSNFKEPNNCDVFGK